MSRKPKYLPLSSHFSQTKVKIEVWSVVNIILSVSKLLLMMAKKRVHDDEEDDGGIEDENCENASEEMEEDEDEDRARRKKKSKKKHKKHIGLMSQSGQTEQDRRILRRKQRELHQDIAIGNGSGGTAAADGGGDDGEELARLRDQNNELWGEVRYTREAVLDGENIDLLAGKAARQAEKIVQVSWLFGGVCCLVIYGLFFHMHHLFNINST